jgi:hypothetical protein
MASLPTATSHLLLGSPIGLLLSTHPAITFRR